MRRRLLASLLVMFGHSYGGDSVPLSAALIVNARTGGILYSNNIDAKTQPASIAKMMTLLIAFQQLKQKIIRLDSMIKISANAASQAPCRLGLKCGDSISVHDAILAMVTKSANDVSVALAEHLAGGSLPRFVDMMNTEAKRLRMTSTRFLNPSGWKDPQQLTTARDIAKLSRALLVEYPSYYRFFSTKSFAFKKHIYKNHNTLLGAKDGIVVDGIKTGFINASGYNTAVSAKKGRDRLIAVFFGGKSARQRDQAVALLLKAGFEKLSARRKAILIAKCTPKSSATHNLLQAHGKLMAAKTTKDHATDRRRFFEDIARRKNILQSKSASTKIHAKAIISDQHDVKSQRISEKIEK